MAATTTTSWEWKQSILKSGKPGKRWDYLPVGDCCPVAKCEWCGRYGSPAWVRGWYLRPWPKDYEPEPVICIGCMNRVRRHWQAQRLILENQKLINKIKREVSRVNAENRR